MSSTGTDTRAERVTRVARVRAEIDVGIWVVIWLSLAFTAINVQIFAARGAEAWSLAWCAAWLLDPMVSILVLVVVRAEQVTSRWQVALGWPITATKWGCFAATYVMNTWGSWVEQSPSMIVLHSVPPAMMLLAAEVGPRIRDGLTRAVLAAGAQEAAAEPAVGGTPAQPTALPADIAPSLDGVRPAVAAPAAGEPSLVGVPGNASSGAGAPVPDVGDVESAATACGAGSALEHEVTDASGCAIGDPASADGTGPAPVAASSPPGPAMTGDDAAAHPAARGLDAGASSPSAEPAPGSSALLGRSPDDDDTPADQPGDDPGDGPLDARGDARVRLLRELLDGDCAVTGPQAAALLTHELSPTSNRTGRRLLAVAREERARGVVMGFLTSDPTPRTPPDSPDSFHRDTTETTDREERERTGTDGAAAPELGSPLSLVPRPTPSTLGDPS